MIGFESFGLLGEVSAENPELAPSLPEALPPGWRPRPAGAGGVGFRIDGDGAVLRDGAPVETPEHVNVPLTALALAVRHHLAEHAPHHVFLHAGVVAVDGVGIVIPASTMSGKTVLVEELVRAGAQYLSDEYAAVDAEGQIHPYPKPLVLRPGTARFGAVEVAERQIAREPVRAGLIVVARYEPGAAWKPRRLEPGEAALALLEHAVPARSRPLEKLRAVGALARDAEAISGVRGEAAPVARALMDALRPVG